MKRSEVSQLPCVESPVEKNSEPTINQIYEDATTLELFFDITIVANLSTFAATHEIPLWNEKGESESLAPSIPYGNSSPTLHLWTYASFVWCTWLSVTLFDVWFTRDSVAARFFDFLQLIVIGSLSPRPG